MPSVPPAPGPVPVPVPVPPRSVLVPGPASLAAVADGWRGRSDRSEPLPVSPDDPIAPLGLSAGPGQGQTLSPV